MNKRQAVAMLELIADLYLVANEPAPEDEVSEANGYREVQLVDAPTENVKVD